MVLVSTAWIGTVLARLRADVAAANQPGNVEGLLSRHLLADDRRLGLPWMVDCNADWIQQTYDPSNLGCVAAVAYTVAASGDRSLLAALEAGLQRAAGRDPKVAGYGAAMHEPAVLIGLCLGARFLRDRSESYLAWCATVVRQLLHGSRLGRAEPMLAHAATLCELNEVTLLLDLHAPILQRAALDWWFRQAGHRGNTPIEQLWALRSSVVEQVLTEATDRLAAHQAALLWLCVRGAVSDAASAALQTPATIAHALRQFEPSMKRWRWDSTDLTHPIRWPIRSEREVQDILWAMLRPICEDIEDEDTLPKFGHSTYRADFGIPSLGLLVEVKYARTGADFKSIEKEILEDLVPYLRAPERYKEVLIFIYDASSSVQQHDTTVRALRNVAGIVDVIVASRPSQLPANESSEGVSSIANRRKSRKTG